MSFAAPWLLLALALLPVLWWLLRVTPPPPRREVFPAIRLLAGLVGREESAARTPWWLLALRLLAAALVIVGLAGPVREAGRALPGTGPLLLVFDNGWSEAADWTARQQAAASLLDRASHAGRAVALFSTAPDEGGTVPPIGPPMPVAEARARLAALRPMPWPVDRTADTALLRGWHRGAVAYLASDLAQPGDAAFAAALAASPAVELRHAVPAERLLLPPRAEADRLVARAAQVAQAVATPPAAVLAQSGDGRTLARAELRFAPGQGSAEAPIVLPPEIRNQIDRLVLAGSASAGSVALLDERWRRRPVGLAAGNALSAEAPLLGPLYYLRRALAPYAELREGPVASLLGRDLSVLILADAVIDDEATQQALAQWVERGGLLLRFAGPLLAEHPDPLLPERLLSGDRQLGGAMSWGKPAHLAAFPPGSPFDGLPAPAEVQVDRQVLAEPSVALLAHSWATLSDGTPLVTEAARGAGRIVLFHVTANADWSNLPLSGLFVAMLRRLVALSAGIATGTDGSVLAPVESLDGFGQLGTPPRAARGLAASAFATTAASPRHPAGLYGPENGRRALDLGASLPPLAAAAPVAGARQARLSGAARARAYGPALLAAALALLAFDLLLALWLRGLLRPPARPMARRGIVLLPLLLLAQPARAQDAAARYPALAVHLAYVVTGDATVDQVSHAGLAGLSDYVNQRTAASIAAPAAVVPGRDDLSVYPLLYWPIVADAPKPAAAAIAALDDFMAQGGIILIDTKSGGSGGDFNPGADASLRRLGHDLVIPPLAPLTADHVLAHSFYLLHDFPGRYDGGTVWVQRDQDRSNDSVSPVIIGSNDWAAAWAVDGDGRNPYAVIPGGDEQRVLAYRFGVNLVMYALTGNYKGDQVHVPAILERLGQ